MSFSSNHKPSNFSRNFSNAIASNIIGRSNSYSSGSRSFQGSSGGHYIPAYDTSVPSGGGNHKSVTIGPDDEITSGYTGKHIKYGPIEQGLLNDAPSGHANYGKPFEYIIKNPESGDLMAYQNKPSLERASTK